MTHRYGILRRFRFNLPQRIAAGLLLLFFGQGLWRIGEAQSSVPLQFPLLSGVFLTRLALLVAGCLLGGGLWWVTRRLFGNLGGYTALALYCFSPAVPRACIAAHAEVLAALGVFGGVYTSIGVAHAMQGPRRKWRPRIVLLTAAFALAAFGAWAALPAAALLGLALMLWVAEGRRWTVPPVVLTAAAGAALLNAAGWMVLPKGGSAHLIALSGVSEVSLDPAWRFSLPLPNAGIVLAVAAALLLYLSMRRSRYFGNTAPLICVAALAPLVAVGAPGVSALWALPFLLTFVGGVFADAYEGPRGRLAMGAAGAIVLVQAACCLWSLPGLR